MNFRLGLWTCPGRRAPGGLPKAWRRPCRSFPWPSSSPSFAQRRGPGTRFRRAGAGGFGGRVRVRERFRLSRLGPAKKNSGQENVRIEPWLNRKTHIWVYSRCKYRRMMYTLAFGSNALLKMCTRHLVPARAACRAPSLATAPPKKSPPAAPAKRPPRLFRGEFLGRWLAGHGDHRALVPALLSAPLESHDEGDQGLRAPGARCLRDVGGSAVGTPPREAQPGFWWVLVSQSNPKALKDGAPSNKSRPKRSRCPLVSGRCQLKARGGMEFGNARCGCLNILNLGVLQREHGVVQKGPRSYCRGSRELPCALHFLGGEP